MDPRDVHIPSPCEADWAAMRPHASGRSRHCELCQTRVHDLSAMTEREAEVFLRATADQPVCLSYLETSTGERLFADSPRRRGPADVVPLHRLRHPPSPPRRPGVAAPLVKTAFAGALAACTPHAEPEILAIDEAPETELLRAASYEVPQIPSAERVEPSDFEVIPCDSGGEVEDQHDEIEHEPQPTPPDIDRPPRIRRTAGIPIRKTGGAIDGPLGGL